MPYSDEFYKDAQYYNRKKAIAVPVYTSAETSSREYADVVATFQAGAGLKVDGKCGPSTLTAMRDELLDGGETKVLTYNDLVHLAEYTKPFEGQYWSCNRDGEYRGLFDRAKPHWASVNNPKNYPEYWNELADAEPDAAKAAKYRAKAKVVAPAHVGLSYGYIQFTQDGGRLGELLTKMYAADSDLFEEIFGQHWADLLEITNRKGNKRKNKKGRKPRVQKVGGYDLWQSYWVDRFAAAGREPIFQRCQVALAVDKYMLPALKNCEKLGLKSARSIVIVFDRGVQYGPGGAYTKLLLPTHRGFPGTEHEFLRKFMQKYDERRWGHRVEKVWRNPAIWDGPCDWSDLAT